MLRYLAIALVALFTLSVTPVLALAADAPAGEMAGEKAPAKEKKMNHKKKGKHKEMDMKSEPTN
ncbi:MAG: hypothetical protein QM537_07750 [Candidatus Symbiobacter sp.]|nr:hypothetical protein [Candidatus Symbiobacter sp.]